MARTILTRTGGILAVCVIMALLPACGDQKEPETSQKPSVTSENVKKEVKDAAETTMTYLEERKKEYQEQVAARLADYDKKLEELKAEAMTMGEEAQAKINQKMEVLQTKVASAYQKLDDLKIAADNTWEASKSHMDSALEEVENAYQETKKEAMNASEKSLAFMNQQKDQYQKRIEAQIKEYDQKLDELEAKTMKVKQESRALLDQQMQSLREKQRAAHTAWEKLSASSGKAWEDMKSGMNRSLDDLSKAYRDAASHFE
jgi:DNA repair exonuclease SbcCD ATPase subunit